ncbi:hypothetical protein T08_9651 [Trichinella sp. T8]|nr:hypothetical protein T08_9651 [Trichinella sp. T8]
MHLILAKRQSCGWHFRYRHPDIAGNWLAHVFTDNTNPLKIKKEQNWTVLGILYHARKKKKKRIWLKWYKKLMFSFISVTVHRHHPMQGEETKREYTKSEFPPCQSMPLKKLAIDLQGDITTVKIRGYAWGYASGKNSKIKPQGTPEG